MHMLNYRMKKDYEEFKKKQPLGVVGGPINEQNLKEWEVTIPGPTGTPYEGGKFKVKIILPDDFPNSAPTCYFLTKIFHPNIRFENGNICVNFLKKGSEEEKNKNKKTWTNKNTICNIIFGLYGLLKCPNQDDAWNFNAHNLFLKDKKRYELIAKNFTNKFAK